MREKEPLYLDRRPIAPGDRAGVYLGHLPVGSFTCLDPDRKVYEAAYGAHRKVCSGTPEVLAFFEKMILEGGGMLAARLDPIPTPKEPST